MERACKNQCIPNFSLIDMIISLFWGHKSAAMPLFYEKKLIAAILTIYRVQYFAHLAWECLFRSTKWGFGEFQPPNGECEQDPKRHPCAGTRHMTYKTSKSVYRWPVGASPRIKRSPKKTQHDISRVRWDLLRCRSATWIYMFGHTRDLVIYSKFKRNPFTGFGATAGRNLPFPITLAIGFYNRLL